MATTLKLRRGTTAQHSSFTGAAGEVTVDTDKETVVVHDGSTAGGFPLARETGSTIKVAAGTVSAPGLTTTGDTNTGIFFPAADTIAFAEGGAEAMRIDSSGRVGIGTGSPAQKLTVSTGTSGGEALRVLFEADAGVQQAVSIGFSNGAALTYPSAKIQMLELDASDNRGSLLFYTRGANTDSDPTERMRIHYSGNVGIGTSSPNNASFAGDCRVQTITGQSADNFGVLELCAPSVTSSNRFGELRFQNLAVAAPYGFSGIRATRDGADSSSAMSFWTSSSNTANERMRIDSSGKVLVNETTRWRGNGQFSMTANSDDGIAILTPNAGLIVRKTSYTNGYLCLWENNGGSIIGSITTDGSVTAYNQSSDYRLKENIAPMTGALEKVAQLKPVTYTWKESGKAGQGFIAHELQAVVPDCVTGEKDAVFEDGSIKPQGVDTSFLVATLTAAIQEQQAIIESLKARLDAAGL